tara:strand:- start:329 stop:739 length:411 start_codon:yes stop_codon:yes gene_type:complete
MSCELNTIDSIFSLEKEMLSMDQLSLDIEHIFSRGVYARKMLIPKGTILTGKMHKHKHLNIMLYGDIEIATDEGTKRIDKPCIFESKAGTKRAGFAHEETVWITIHATEETDIQKIEANEIAENPLQYLEELRGNL